MNSNIIHIVFLYNINIINTNHLYMHIHLRWLKISLQFVSIEKNLTFLGRS